MAAAGSEASAQRGQDVSEKARRAAALDEVERYNAASREAAARYNAQLPRQAWEMMLQKLAGRTGQLSALAGADRNQAQSERQLYSGLGGAAYEGLSGLGQKRGGLSSGRGAGSTSGRMTPEDYQALYGTPPPPGYY